jgi:hypothetical protein
MTKNRNEAEKSRYNPPNPPSAPPRASYRSALRAKGSAAARDGSPWPRTTIKPGAGCTGRSGPLASDGVGDLKIAARPFSEPRWTICADFFLGARSFDFVLEIGIFKSRAGGRGLIWRLAHRRTVVGRPSCVREFATELFLPRRFWSGRWAGRARSMQSTLLWCWSSRRNFFLSEGDVPVPSARLRSHIPHDSMRQFWSLNHVQGDAVDSKSAFPKLPANRT